MGSILKLRTKKPSNRPKVCVIGAGVAGLRCADVLLDHGFEVTILEARERIGGRLHQVQLSSGHLVDGGPNWIHGTEGNPIMELAKKTTTTTYSWEGQVHTFGDDGKILSEGKNLDEEMWGIIMQAFKYSESNSSTIDPQESLHDFFKQQLEEKYPGAVYDGRKKLIMQMSEIWGSFVGSSIKTQSLKFFWLEECLDGENLFCAGTFSKILDVIARPALQKADLKLSTKVTHIETGPDKVKVTTNEGAELEFDEVVTAAPLGWLKQNKHAFAPPLPPRLSQAIDAIGYGSLEKVYLTFPRAFWLGEATNPDKKLFTGFTQWLSPSYALHTNPKRWNQETVDLATLPGSCAQPTLLFYIFGEQSSTLAKEIAALPSTEAKGQHLINFFTPYFSLFPHYKEDSMDCKPVAWYATDWVLDPLAGNGSYCNFQTGLVEGDKDIEIMKQGLPGRGLWFAGEHTAPFVALGTVTGAYWSGEGVARRIAEAYAMASKTHPTS